MPHRHQTSKPAPHQASIFQPIPSLTSTILAFSLAVANLQHLHYIQSYHVSSLFQLRHFQFTFTSTDCTLDNSKPYFTLYDPIVNTICKLVHFNSLFKPDLLANTLLQANINIVTIPSALYYNLTPTTDDLSIILPRFLISEFHELQFSQPRMQHALGIFK